MKKILFLSIGELEPSTRFRILPYIPYLENAGWNCSVWHRTPSFGSRLYFLKFYGGRYINARLIDLIALFGTLAKIRLASRYDIVFLQRGLPDLTAFPWVEILLRRYSKRLIYDYDDALYLRVNGKSEPMRSKAYERRLGKIFRMSDHIIGGNVHLSDYTGYPGKTTCIPTSIDTQKFSPRGKTRRIEGKTIIGWTGTSGNYSYLSPLSNVFNRLASEYPGLTIKIISEMEPKRGMFGNAPILYVPWSSEQEAEQLADIDIGLMYLDKKEWAKGKCGFKLIQYMALGKPVVASPIGANIDIVKDGQNGLFAKSQSDWFESLAMLIEDRYLRERMGAEARATIEQAYSIEHNSIRLLSLLNRL